MELLGIISDLRTLLMNIRTLDWEPQLLEFFNLPNNILPTIKSSSGKEFHTICKENISRMGGMGVEFPDSELVL